MLSARRARAVVDARELRAAEVALQLAQEGRTVREDVVTVAADAVAASRLSNRLSDDIANM